MGKKSRRNRHRAENAADADELHRDKMDNMIEFTSDDITRRTGGEPLRNIGLFIHPLALRKVLDWGRVVATARDAGHPDPTTVGVISFKSNGRCVRLVFSDCCAGHPAALLSPYEAAMLSHAAQTREEVQKASSVVANPVTATHADTRST